MTGPVQRVRLPGRRRLLAGAVLAPTAAAFGAPAAPPDWPSRPVRIVVAYPPGGVSDEVARLLAEKLGMRLGVPVLVQNRPGAGGGVAIESLARSPPDGYTLCYSAVTPLTLLPHLGPVGYEPTRDIAPLVSVMYTPVLLVGTPALAARTFGEMLAAAGRRPGPLRWATSGIGTTGHMVLEQVRIATRIAITHVPYKGGGHQLNDALGGQFEVLSTNVAAQQLEYVRLGRLKALAVGAPRRLPVLPDVPTLAEAGLPQANLVSLFGVFAPARTPPSVLQRLNADLNEVLRQPDVRRRLLAVNNVPTGGSPADFALQIAREGEANRRALRAGRSPSR